MRATDRLQFPRPGPPIRISIVLFGARFTLNWIALPRLGPVPWPEAETNAGGSFQGGRCMEAGEFRSDVGDEGGRRDGVTAPRYRRSGPGRPRAPRARLPGDPPAPGQVPRRCACGPRHLRPRTCPSAANRTRPSRGQSAERCPRSLHSQIRIERHMASVDQALMSDPRPEPRPQEEGGAPPRDP